jgi:hypothetical protein
MIVPKMVNIYWQMIIVHFVDEIQWKMYPILNFDNFTPVCKINIHHKDWNRKFCLKKVKY